MKRKKTISNIIYHVLVCAFGLVMIYPLVWMVMSSFKDTNTIFTTATSLIPEKFTLQNCGKSGWCQRMAAVLEDHTEASDPHDPF